MTRRVRCKSCQTAFVLQDDTIGQPITCPKCGVKQRAAPAVKTVKETLPAPAESVFVPSEPARRSRRGVWIGFGFALLVVAAVAGVIAWPAFYAWWRPRPLDPVESVATAYLRSLIDGDADVSRRLGTVDLPPAIRTFRAVRHDRARNQRLKGSFGPIAAFHAKINETYAYDPATGRFAPRNPLGPAAETLDALHDAKAKAEKDGLYKKMESGNPDDLFDAAESLGKTFNTLAEGVLSPKKLLPSYKQLIDDAKPPLPSAEKSMALDFADNRETWDALLKRPFTTLKADGPFLLERAEVTASIVDALGSLGDPPTPLRLTLTRFRLEGIDTGWKVTAAHRGAQRPEPTREAAPSLGSRRVSPGETSIDGDKR